MRHCSIVVWKSVRGAKRYWWINCHCVKCLENHVQFNRLKFIELITILCWLANETHEPKWQLSTFGSIVLLLHRNLSDNDLQKMAIYWYELNIVSKLRWSCTIPYSNNLQNRYQTSIEIFKKSHLRKQIRSRVTNDFDHFQT